MEFLEDYFYAHSFFTCFYYFYFSAVFLSYKISPDDKQVLFISLSSIISLTFVGCILKIWFTVTNLSSFLYLENCLTKYGVALASTSESNKHICLETEGYVYF